MDVRSKLRSWRELGRALADPNISPPSDEADGYQLAISARDFSKATRKVVDEKLTFSAALLRAGEVHEANKILAEVEHDVRNEEAALLERMNEVTAARAVKKAYMTRMRLVRLLATAMVGAGLLGVSAMGMAVASIFEERQKGDRGKVAHAGRFGGGHGRGTVKKVKIAGVPVRLTKKDLATFRRLTSGTVDAGRLEHFLVADLDLPPGLVDQAIANVLALPASVTAQVEEVVVKATAPAKEAAAEAVALVKKKAEKAKKEAAQPEEEPAPAEPAEEETPAAETEEGDDDGGSGDDDGDGADGDGDEQKSGLGGLPKI